jgi:hypothetical protein
MPTQKLARKQHIVTRGLLANFVDGEGFLWVYEKNKPTRRSQPRNECAERDFYEYESNGRTTQNRYENWLGRIESDAVPLLELLIERRPLARWQAVSVSLFIASLFTRTRKYRAQISNPIVEKFRNPAKSPDFVRDLQCRLWLAGEPCFRKDLQEEIDELRDAMERSPSFYHVVGLPRRTAVLAEAILQKSWGIIEAPSGLVFVASDCPVSTMEFTDGRAVPGAGFGKEDTAVFLPLSPQHAFVASRAGWPRTADARFVEALNHLTVCFAHRNVYANSDFAALRALVDAQINQIVFGENALIHDD